MAQLSPMTSALTRVTVGEAMRPGVITCLPDADLPTMAAIMVAHGIHAVVVASPEPGTPLTVTDLELVRASLERADEAHAIDLACEPPGMLSIEAPLADAVEMMTVRYVAHLLAFDPGSVAPAGIVSSLDVAAVAGGWEPRLARMLRPGPARPSSSARTLSEAIVSGVMHPGIATCRPDVPLSTVARIMAEHRVHSVAVAGIDATNGRDQHLTWGLIEDMELVGALHRHAVAAPAATIALTGPVAVHESASLDDAATLMVEHGTRHVVAVGPSGFPAGMVSTLDVLGVIAASR